MDEELIKIVVEEVLAELAKRGISVEDCCPCCSEDSYGDLSKNTEPSTHDCGTCCDEERTQGLGAASSQEHLITEAVANSLCGDGIKEVCLLKTAIVTPSALDVFRRNKVVVNKNA